LMPLQEKPSQKKCVYEHCVVIAFEQSHCYREKGL
jgi:hypothetical protein